MFRCDPRNRRWHFYVSETSGRLPKERSRSRVSCRNLHRVNLQHDRSVFTCCARRVLGVSKLPWSRRQRREYKKRKRTADDTRGGDRRVRTDRTLYVPFPCVSGSPRPLLIGDN